ncbi:hypothetical protein ACFX13_022276 [Malus domestica]|uniref:Uncharacterized protein n=1 Tax=Malus domestica TaxID=3750 RepID=A0A498HM67_MALDO|nr:hypothetical protein DVH24_025540 [Malus domestica]
MTKTNRVVMRMEARMEQTTSDGAGEAESKAGSDDDGGGGCGESGYGFGCESRRLVGDARVGWAATMERERRKG